MLRPNIERSGRIKSIFQYTGSMLIHNLTVLGLAIHTIVNLVSYSNVKLVAYSKMVSSETL